MQRAAVFVDAGYLFAQGSAALTGSSKKRENLVLDAPAAIAELKNTVSVKCSGCSLLRIYWYDGSMGGGRLSGDQALLAGLDDVKVRLGFINSHGQQKGVDSLIVTDMIELARLQSICDAVLLSGDEDVRVGVQIAQNYGVRVHLLGIYPSRGSQSAQLLMEADTTTEWDQQTVRRFLSERHVISPPSVASAPNPPLHPPPPQSAQTTVQGTSTQPTFDQNLELAAKTFSDDLQASEVEGLAAYWNTSARGFPAETDRRILSACRLAIGRDLDQSEKRWVRGRVQKFVRDRSTSLSTSAP